VSPAFPVADGPVADAAAVVDPALTGAAADGAVTDTVSPTYDASAITVLEGLDAVRKRPGMYIGSTGERGLHHLVYEVVDNSVDEALQGHCDEIDITLLADGGVRVIDNGRGIPVDEVESEHLPAVTVVLTVLHAGGKFGGGGYKVSGGLHGVGVSVVNALSARLTVEVRREGYRWSQSFALGNPTGPLERHEETDAHGTTITFWPSNEIFETTNFSFETLSSRFREMAFLNKGLRLNLRDERTESTVDPADEVGGSGNTGGELETEPDLPAAEMAETPADRPARSVSYRYDGGLIDYVDHLNAHRTRSTRSSPSNRRTRTG